MKFNQSLTAALTAAALVAGAGFAYAQTATPAGDSPAQGMQARPAGTDVVTTPAQSGTMQSQPSTTTGTSMDTNTTMQRDMVTPEPRADRN